MKRFFIGTLTLLVGTAFMYGASRAKVDRYQAGSQYYAYPVDDSNAPRLTEPPAGYEPFHIEHYGRHGSRWLTADELYVRPVSYLRQADMKGKLTPKGKSLLGQLEAISVAAKNRAGELTPLGHRQHRGIARRMAKNFPEIYRDGNYVNANSTIVIRCILSMANEIAELRAIQPGLDIRCDASMTTQDTLNFNHLDAPAQRFVAKATAEVAQEFASRPRDISSFTGLIFNDDGWARDSIDSRSVFKSVFEVAANSQSHDGLYDLYEFFTDKELDDEWVERNADWYVTACNTPLTSGRVPYEQRHLLRSIIEGADSAMVSGRVGANLRFGHESVLLPLITLMEVNGVDYSTSDMDSLASHWRNFDYFPMASNIQMVFYRPVREKAGRNQRGRRSAKNIRKDHGLPSSSDASSATGDILVKVLLNEKEVPLPIETSTYPYYRWADLRAYYDGKLSSFPVIFPE